jgi:hypothetical protein
MCPKIPEMDDADSLAILARRQNFPAAGEALERFGKKMYSYWADEDWSEPHSPSAHFEVFEDSIDSL